jgi:hypothetical protein
MQKVKVLAFLVLAAFLAFSCSKNDDSSTGDSNTGGNSNAGSLSSHAGKNLTVTESNADSVSAIVMQTTSEVFGKAIAVAGSGLTKPAIDIPLSGTVNGTISGHASVSGKYVVSTDYSTIQYNLTCTFFDYSDDSVLYYGGATNYAGSMVMETSAYNLTFKGGLKFNGTYQGTQDFTTTYTYTPSTSATTYHSTINTTSGGKTFTTTFDYPQ